MSEPTIEESLRYIEQAAGQLRDQCHANPHRAVHLIHVHALNLCRKVDALPEGGWS